MAELVGNTIAVLVVLAALVYLVARFTGVLDRWKRARKPDVSVKSLVRKKREEPDDDCCG